MNAKKELIDFLTDKAQIKCASISFDQYYHGYKPTDIILKEGYSQESLEEFLNKLNVNYNNGYGGQELWGTVWLMDNTWLTRGEYDGSEWWEHHVIPKIPELCKQ